MAMPMAMKAGLARGHCRQGLLSHVCRYFLPLQVRRSGRCPLGGLFTSEQSSLLSRQQGAFLHCLQSSLEVLSTLKVLLSLVRLGPGVYAAAMGCRGSAARLAKAARRSRLDTCPSAA